jgi:hypothetical protein
VVEEEDDDEEEEEELKQGRGSTLQDAPPMSSPVSLRNNPDTWWCSNKTYILNCLP